MGDEDIREIFAPLGPVFIRRMFSGKGIYFQGLIVAIVYDAELRLKADAISAVVFRDAGSVQWTYEGSRGAVLMPYWSVPHDAFDDVETMRRWLRLALDAARRIEAKKTPPKSSRQRRPERSR